VSAQSVGLLLAAGVGGFVQGRYTVEGRRQDIRFKLDESQLRSAADLQNIYVRNLVGNLIPLGELVEVREGSAVQSISRINRQRAIGVFGNLGPGQSQGEVLREIQDYLNSSLPSGYSYGLEGSSAGFSESMGGPTLALLIGLMTAYLLLAVQFNSFVQPISVLMALPFSLSGAFLALWIWGVSLNMFSFIGLVVLMGIAKKNSILLVEFTNQMRERGGKVHEALLSACPLRLRPILMTSVATLAEALPLMLGDGFGSETRLPMGLSIFGGTLLSTLLTLYVTPSWYLILSRLEKKRPVK
ncbi:MAG: efflux RND transporter permease subunit, partial [bacterium]